MKWLSGIILTIFLGLMFVSLFHMPGSMGMSHGDGMSGMSNCPFMANQEVLCAMNLNEHMSAWKAVFSNLVPTAFTLLLALGVVGLARAIAPHLLTRLRSRVIIIYWRQLQQKTYTYLVRPHQELFSSGVLHPKLF